MGAAQKKTHDEQAHLVLIDEAGQRMAPLLRRTQAPRGQAPVLKVKGAHRQKVSMAAALVTSPGAPDPALFFRTYPDAYVDQAKAADFLEELLRQLAGKVIVVWDRGNMHRGEAIRDLLRRHAGRLELVALPPYAPDLNPVEHLWNYLKYDELANFVPRSVLHLDAILNAELEVIQQDSQRLRSFYHGSELPLAGIEALAA